MLTAPVLLWIAVWYKLKWRWWQVETFNFRWWCRADTCVAYGVLALFVAVMGDVILLARRLL